MGCFSFICPICGKGINSSSFHGENVRLTLLSKGKILEEMQGAYDSYGRVFGTEKDPNDKSFTETTSIEWKKDWNRVCDLMFEGNSNSGIAAIHVACIPKGYKPITKSADDPDQGWNPILRKHTRKCETYHHVTPKSYKVIVHKDTDVVDLINVDDESDTIPGAPDEFVNGEILTEEQITLKNNNYVDDYGVGTMLFAFRK